jgi:hypothetical protein
VQGIFEFSEAKQHYYAGSSLIWLNGAADAERAAREAAEAIAMWTQEPPESRSLDDEALAHVYQGTAYLQLGQLDAATHAVRPILDLPPERQISWIRKRLARFAGMLRGEPYTGSHEATTSTTRSKLWPCSPGTRRRHSACRQVSSSRQMVVRSQQTAFRSQVLIPSEALIKQAQDP